VLFWHTFNGVDVKTLAPEPGRASALPPRLARIAGDLAP
jgi:hypothetical protein